jgi:hypothetical protein
LPDVTTSVWSRPSRNVRSPSSPDTQPSSSPGVKVRNLGTETLVFFATCFAPKTTPPLPVRLDARSPASGCPQ